MEVFGIIICCFVALVDFLLIVRGIQIRVSMKNHDPNFEKKAELFRNGDQGPIIKLVRVVFGVRLTEYLPLDGDEKNIIRSLVIEEVRIRAWNVEFAAETEQKITEPYRGELDPDVDLMPKNDYKKYKKAHNRVERCLTRFYYARDLGKLIGYDEIPEKWGNYLYLR